MIPVTPRISLDEKDLHETFVRSSGPGGQNVNKVETAVELRFDVRHARGLPDEVAIRLMKLAGRRVNKEGVLVIQASRFRTQDQNRQDARERLIALVAEAARPPPPKRKPTRPTLASRERRLQGKSLRSGVKKMRGSASED